MKIRSEIMKIAMDLEKALQDEEDFVKHCEKETGRKQSDVKISRLDVSLSHTDFNSCSCLEKPGNTFVSVSKRLLDK